MIFNRLYRFGPTQFISGAMILLAISLTFMLASASYIATMFTLAFIWGIGISCIGLALQMRVLQLAPDATDVASAIYSGIFNAGIGAKPPTPELGTMLSESRSFMQAANWLVTIPGLVILSLVLAFNLMGDGLRDALDPKLKQ